MTRLAAISSSGTGSPIALFHGNSQRAAQLERILDSPLGARHRMIAFDLPGHGDSPHDPGAYSLDGLARSLVAAQEHAGIERPVLVGHSLGGHLAIRVAQRIEVRGLFLFCTPPSRSLEDLQASLQPVPEAGLLFQEHLDDAELDAVSLLVAGDGPDRQRVREAIARTDPRFRAGLAASVAAHYDDEVAALAGAPFPVALVHGRGDPLISDRWVRQLRFEGLWRGAPQAIDGGHVPHLENPAELTALLEAYLLDLER